MPVLSGERWGAATSGVTTITWSFATSNFSTLATKFQGYKDFDTSINLSYQGLIQNAFAAWEAVANIDFVQVADSAIVNIRLGNLYIDGNPAPGQGSTLGNTASWYIGNTYSAAQIVFDVDAYDDNATLYEVAVHEIGHAIGLDHSPIMNAVMYYLANSQNLSGKLTSDDIAGVVAIYGAKSGATADDYLATTATTGAVTIGSSATGWVETTGDVDWFRVTLTAGHAYRFDLEGSATGFGTLADPSLELRSSTGGLLTSYDNGGTGLNSRGTYTAQTGGTFYLAAQAKTSTATGTYKLSVTDLTPTTSSQAVLTAGNNILRQADNATTIDQATKVGAGTLSLASAIGQLVKTADATTSVAILNYQFFTGSIPSLGGIDYLVSPTGPNANNINSAYYQLFSLENRYINFAVNLGKVGAGQAQFQAAYGSLDLLSATRQAYTTIFGATPSDTKLHALLDPTFVMNGQTMTRAQYFAYYGGDGPNGLGTKAAMVGWLLAEAEKADLGSYARSNAAFLTDLADGANFGVNLIGVYGKPEYIFNPG
jgi:predicted Zn-dependent protease